MSTVTVTINIKDENSAKQWLEQVREINTDYNNAMADSTECIIQMNEFAEGTLIDDYVKFANDLMDAAKKTFQAIDEIADTVNKILGFAGSFKENAVSGIAKLAGKIFN